MSNIVSGIAQKRSVGSPARKAVLMLMASCASDDGTGIWVSKANMASDLEMSKRTVQKAIADLVEMGVLREVGKRPCKNGYTVEYGVNLEILLSLSHTRAPVQQVHPCSRFTPRRAAGSPQDVQQVHPNSPRTILEPSEEPPCIPPEKKPEKSRLPENWVLGDEERKYAHSMQLFKDETEEIANDFHIYWTERTDAGGRKTERGWQQAWRNWVRKAAPEFRRNRIMAGGPQPQGYGRGGGIASVVARRESQRQI